MTREERVAKIKQCLDRKSGSFRRLRRIAFSDSTDRASFQENSFDLFFDMASTARIFFSRREVVGGFPKEPFERVQSSRCCYLVSACSWYTLKLQQDLPQETSEEPIDVAQCARRKIINNDGKLEKRVISNLGGSSFEVVKELTGRTNEDDWALAPFSLPTQSVYGLSQYTLDLLESYGVGLVTGFTVPPNFAKRAKEKPKGIGYWKFDGIDVDCEGEFIKLNKDDEMCQSERVRLHKKWEEQKERAEKKFKKCKDYQVLPSPTHLKYPPGDDGAEKHAPNEDDDPPGVDSGQKHSMVMLGGYKAEENAPTKHYFMLMNWWRGMPLVLVSAGYLQACQCKVVFLAQKLTEDTDLDRKEAAYAEVLYPDEGEDCAAISASFDSLERQEVEEDFIESSS